VHVLSFTPRLIAERVSIGNPPWTPSGTAAEIGKITLAFDLPRNGHSFDIANLEMQDVTLHLIRDSQGRANWQLSDPRKGGKRHVTVVHALSVAHAHVVLDDARRHLQFDARSASARAVESRASRGCVWMNRSVERRPATFEIYGDPLAGATRAKPYHFTFAEQSSGSKLAGRGSLPHPFNFDFVDATFDASGADMKDLYFLTGVTFVNTALSAVRQSGAKRNPFRVQRFVRAVGAERYARTVSVDSSTGRSRIKSELHSQFLRIADIGARAPGARSCRSPASGCCCRTRASARRGYAAPMGRKLRARRVEVGRINLTGVAAHITIDGGVLAVTPLTRLASRQAPCARDARRQDRFPPCRLRHQARQFAARTIGKKIRQASCLEGLLGRG